jgi:hypothetical protein
MSIPFDPTDGLHVSSWPTRGKLWSRSKPAKRAILRQGRDAFPVLVYLAATIEIQRYWRGVLLRRRVLKHFLHGGFVRLWKRDEAVLADAYRLVPKPSERELSNLASMIQSRWRTTLLRQEFRRWSSYDTWPIYYVAAATIQRLWADYCYVKKKKAMRHRSKRMYASREDAMAGRIQLAWRGFVNRQVFSFYKRLVHYREGSDALRMLRSINASEAFLMDPAAGLHVRFRLGGATFPPVILYKIYTHRPVADIGAFAPKDYTKAPARLRAVDVHNAIDLKRTANGLPQQAPKTDDRATWYRRVENNEWRAVSEDVFYGPNATASMPDDVRSIWEQRVAPYLVPMAKARGGGHEQPGARATWRNRPRAPKFHALASKRREAKAQQAKETKRRWLVELYSAEQERHARSGDRDSVRAEAATLFGTLTDAEVDGETQRLMEWTEHLDFDSYYDSWLRAATTAPTDAIVTVGSPL